jgi:DNA-binding MarR family transcriptional regulator
MSGRELAVLLVLAGGEPASQQQVAGRLGVDRTTMVAFLEALEGKGLVERHADTSDRRRNVVMVTAAGQETLYGAAGAGDEAERQFLAPLDETAAEQLRRALTSVVHGEGRELPSSLREPP